MSVSALVVTLSIQPDRANRVLRELEAHPQITVGELNGQKLPIVLDTPSVREDEAAFEWMNHLADVDHVDVVYIDFGDSEDPIRIPDRNDEAWSER